MKCVGVVGRVIDVRALDYVDDLFFIFDCALIFQTVPHQNEKQS